MKIEALDKKGPITIDSLSLSEPERSSPLLFDPQMFIKENHFLAMIEHLRLRSLTTEDFGRVALIAKTLGRDDYFYHARSLWKTRLQKQKTTSAELFKQKTRFPIETESLNALAWMKVLEPEMVGALDKDTRLFSYSEQEMRLLVNRRKHDGVALVRDFLPYAFGARLVFPTHFPQSGLLPESSRQKIQNYFFNTVFHNYRAYERDLWWFSMLRLIDEQLFKKCESQLERFTQEGIQELNFHSYLLMTQRLFISFASNLCILSARKIVNTPTEFRVVFDEPRHQSTHPPLPITRNF